MPSAVVARIVPVCVAGIFAVAVVVAAGMPITFITPITFVPVRVVVVVIMVSAVVAADKHERTKSERRGNRGGLPPDHHILRLKAPRPKERARASDQTPFPICR